MYTQGLSSQFFFFYIQVSRYEKVSNSNRFDTESGRVNTTIIWITDLNNMVCVLLYKKYILRPVLRQ